MVSRLNSVKSLSSSKKRRRGFTITELMVSVLIISMAVALLQQGLVAHLRTLRVAALLQESQDFAFSELWQRYGLPFQELQQMIAAGEDFSTPESFRIGTRGEVRFRVLPDATNLGHLTLVCQVWAPALVGYGEHYRESQMLVEYQIERYDW